MAGGSQLTQLKSAIHGAGLARSNSSGSKKKRAGGGSGGKAKSSMGDPEARKKKLEAISQSLNSFDVKTSKTKHAILGARPLKGSTGRPGLSRQVGIENRKKTLLPQLLDRDRSGGVVDRRFGEGDASLTPEEKAIQRFALERQRRAGKAALFNLGDNEENGLGLLGEGDVDGGGDTLTHFGQNLANVRGALPDQEDFFQKSGRMGSAARGALASEGGEEQMGRDAADGMPQRKKSRAEVMEEVIAKSKAYKYERQRVRTEDDEIRLALDDDLAGIRALLGAPNLRLRTGESTSAAPTRQGDEAVPVPSASDAPEASDAQDGNGTEEDDDDLEADEDDGGSDDEELDDVSDASSEGDAGADVADAPLAIQAGPSTSASNGGGVRLTFIKAPVDAADSAAAPSGTASSGVDRSLLAGLLGAGDGDGDDAADGTEAQAAPVRRRHRRTEEDDIAEANTDDPYDRFVRELAFEKRAAPSDRLRTPAELAQEAAAQLQKSEARRLKRMRGEEDDSASDDAEGSDDELSSRKRKKGKAEKSARRAEGDDLGDDFDFEGDEVRGFGLGGGLAVEDAAEDVEESDEGDLEDEDNSEDDDEEESEGESDVGSEKDENEMLADLLHGDEASAEEDEAEALVKPVRKGKGKQVATSRKELPFTFPCPATHEELLELLDGTDEQDLPVVVERIRTLYHPSLAEGNKQKLATFLTVLVDHLLYTAATSSFGTSSALLPHITALSQSFPITFSNSVVSKLTLMQKNLARGLASGPLLPTSKTWPGPGELALLRLVGVVFSTSDFSHVVAAPALLLISQYLGQCRLRTISDLASGLFLCTLALQYESMSKRVVPEAVNFLAQAVALLLPRQPSVPLERGSYPMPDLDREDLVALLRLQEADDDTRPDELDLLQLLDGATDAGAARVGLAKIALALISEFSGLYNTLPAFIELFYLTLRSLSSVELLKLPPSVQRKLSTVSDSLGRMLKFSRQARRPLTLQSHKPIPIPSFLPKFEEGYAPGRRFDPDSERNEASKLKALVKKERKGAVRELRKDNRFLAGERQKIQRQKDAEYKGKINRITAGLEKERHEEKRFARTKEIERTRDKKRAGEAGGSRGGRGGRGRGGRGGGGGRGASRGGRGGRGQGA